MPGPQQRTANASPLRSRAGDPPRPSNYRGSRWDPGGDTNARGTAFTIKYEAGQINGQSLDVCQTKDLKIAANLKGIPFR